MEWILLAILGIVWYYGHSIYSELEYFREQNRKAVEASSDNNKALLDALRTIKDETLSMAHALHDISSKPQIIERAAS